MTSRRIIALLGALLAAVVSASLAPSDWDAGNGRVVLDYRGATVISETAAVGVDDPILFEGEAEGKIFEAFFPAGIPVDATVTALVGTAQNGAVLTPDIGDLGIRIELPDGTPEELPLVSWDEQEQGYRAQRRPPQNAAAVLALLGFVVVAWVSEVVPLFVTSLFIPVVLVVTGSTSAAAATQPFFHPIIVLFFAGFLMAEAMHRSGLDRYVALSIIERAGRRAVVLFVTMLGFAAFMSMWMSNTAAIAILIPIALAVTAPMEHEGFRKAVVLGIAFAGTIGGVGSAIGTPANQLAIEFLDSFAGRMISFTEWFAFGLPMVVLFLPIMAVYLWQRAGVKVDASRFRQAEQVARQQHEELGNLDRHQLQVLAVFALVFVGWLTQTFHGVHPGIVALAGAVALFALGRLRPGDLGRISWESLLTFGGGLTLGFALVASGVSDYLATRLSILAGMPQTLALLIVAGITLALTTVASNTASAAILIPVALPLAGVLGIDPTLVVLVVAIASSIDFALVVGTPPTMIAYSTRLYTAGQIFRTGIVLDVIGVLLLVLGVTAIWEWMGLL